MTATGPRLHQSSYPYYQEKGFSITQIDTYYPIFMAVVENRMGDAIALLRAVLQSEGDEGLQRTEQFKKAFIAHQEMLKKEIDAAEEQKNQYEQNQKQKIDLEEEFSLFSIQEKSIRDAIRENDAKPSAPRSPILSQPKLKPMSTAVSSASAAVASLSSSAEHQAPSYHMTASAAAAATTHNSALPPRQSGMPKLPSTNPLNPRAQASVPLTSALRSTFAARTAASSSSTNAATQLDMEAPLPAYLVQAKASAKPATSKPNAKQASTTAPIPLPPTPCYARATSASAVSVPRPARSSNSSRPSK